MKFRGKITDIISIRQFAQLLHTLSRCAKYITIRILPDKMILVLADNTENRGFAISGWCDIPKDPFFLEFQMEGVTPEDNEIYLMTNADTLSSTLSGLKTAHNVKALKMKLTKKATPCITFEIESQTTNSTQNCLHDIPVTIIHRRTWPEFHEPELPKFDVSLGMPDIKVVRQTLERIRNLGPKVTVSGFKSGRLEFSVESCAVKSTVTYSDLKVYHLDGEGDEDDDVSGQNQNGRRRSSTSRLHQTEYVSEVDMKSLVLVVPNENLKPTNFICSLSEGRMLHLLYLYGDICFHVCLPAVGV